MCALAFSVLAIVLIADVLLREISGNGLPWVQQSGIYANVVVALFGLGLATSAGSHLRPRFADHWLPLAWQPMLQRIGYAVTGFFLLLFAVFALQFSLQTRALDEVATVLRIPLWPMQLLIVIAFASAALRSFIYCLQPQLGPESD